MTSADVVASLKRWMGHEVACIRWEETGAFAGTSSPASARPLL